MKKKGLIIIAAILLTAAVLCVISYYARGNDEVKKAVTSVTGPQVSTTTPISTENNTKEDIQRTTDSQTVAYSIDEDSIEITVIGDYGNSTEGDKNEQNSDYNEPSGNEIVID